MDGAQIADWTYRVVAFIGGSGVLLWMRQAIIALRTTVETQKVTIEAQTAKMNALEGLLTTMGAVLKSTDERSMLERLEAHKKFVEHEGEAKVKQLAAKFEVDTRELQAGHSFAMESLTKLTTALITFATNVLPYVPKARRIEFIRLLEVTDTLEPIKTGLYDLATTAPDISGESVATEHATAFDGFVDV